MINTQQFICEAYGYTAPLPPTDEIFKIGKKNDGKIALVSENTEPCSMCGKVHPVGYASKIGATHLLKTMIPNSYNKCYALIPTNFICEHCGYSLVAYGSPSKMKYGKKMVNALVDENGYKEMYFNSDEKNELYALMKKPPKPPFVILINSGGTVIENLVYTAKPTLSKKYFVVNYGNDNMEVSIDEVFECLHDARVIAAKLNIEPSTEQLFNRQNDVKHKPSNKLLKNNQFVPLVGDFLEKYNRDCRIVSKMVLAAYLKEHKEPIALPKTDSKKTASQSLFDF
jgi:CRISPR type IV-associated protein Csf1